MADVIDLPERAALVDRVSVGGGLSRVTLRGRPELLATHTAAGQYTEIQTDGSNGYFVIASDVGTGAWELVLRGGGGAADALLGAPIGEEFAISPALGAGFPLDAARGRPLVLAVNGTGIAAARPVVTRRIAESEAARTIVYLGVRTAREVPLADELDAWRAEGVRVTLCLSQAGELAELHAAPGYVQDVVRAQGRADGVAGGMIFAVGTESMIAALRDVAPSVGVAPGDVRTNY